MRSIIAIVPLQGLDRLLPGEQGRDNPRGLCREDRPMTPEQIISKVDEILIEEFELESDLVVALEKAFGVRVEDKAIMAMKTVADIHGYIHANYGKPQEDAAASK